MSIATKVKLIELDPNSLFKTQKINVSSSKSFETPIKAINLKQLKQKFNLDTNLKNLSEIFRCVNKNSIEKYHSDPTFEENFNKDIISDLNKIDESKNCKICFLDFDETRYPNQDEIETLTSIAHSYSDITPLPILKFINKKKISDKEFDDYKTFVSNSIKSIEQFNNKPIMGVIPILPTKFINQLIELYARIGINAFCIDLGGANPISFMPRIRKILLSIKNNKPLEECYIHSFNVGIGRPNKIEEVIPAKDILGPGFGFGSIGNKYKKFKPSKQFIEFIKTNPEHKFRLFNKIDYGYWRGISQERVKDVFPKDCKIDSSLFTSYKDKSFLQRLFNAEQMALEAINMRKQINEEPEKFLDYVKGKKYVISDDFEKLKTMKNKI